MQPHQMWAVVNTATPINTSHLSIFNFFSPHSSLPRASGLCSQNHWLDKKMNKGHPTDDSSATVQGHSSESTTVNIEPMSEDHPPKYTPSVPPTTRYAPPTEPPPPLTSEQPRYAPPNVPPPPKKLPENSYGATNGSTAAGRSTEGSPLLGNTRRSLSTVWSDICNGIRPAGSYCYRFRGTYADRT